MPTNPLSLRNDQSVKLSVTVKSRLEKKYNPNMRSTKLRQQSSAGKARMLKRGIQTVHVHVDDNGNE